MYKDSENERNYLTKNIYPKLRDFFNTEYGVDFQVNIDLSGSILVQNFLPPLWSRELASKTRTDP